MASILDLLKSVRGLGGAGGGGGAPQGAGAQPNRSRSQAEQELVTWHAIKAWVAQEKLKIAREEEDKRTIVTVWSTAEGGGDCISILRAQENFLKCTFMSKMNIPPNRIANAARYFNMANWGMNVGSFEMDQSDGEVSFKMNYVVENMDEEYIMHVIDESHPMGLVTFGRYHRMMGRLIDGEDPTELVKIVEQSSN
eukprot:TRINITY_DN7389_c0_g1_i1.p1 TRINITY_DN7389_c0_g1~~TRINITY_DN7389_c0_g1_i1.p1  ORF type:complete len:205 (-),score=50.25 TRINITY_DN7389_c0_g1_i1:87-674(-)